ncbi:unnamed protein product [Candidula unifasciata]|uniref:N-terminal methionine N(alpha)-acetyltransferase NatC n=1 Tax=Candidula unifasciata TaxID=100452 RepID=A0A8S4AA56_9EUPU|nr:unnamed protein product [Candidula unifasciata]
MACPPQESEPCSNLHDSLFSNCDFTDKVELNVAVCRSCNLKCVEDDGADVKPYSCRLQSENGFEFSEKASENQKSLKCSHIHGELRTLSACHHNNDKHDHRKVITPKCLEKVNGVTHMYHLPGDNNAGGELILVDLLNTRKGEAADTENHSFSGDSGRGSGSACQCTENDCDDDDVSCDEIEAEKICSSEVHSNTHHNEVDALLNDLEKTSLDQLSPCEHCPALDNAISDVTYTVYESEKQMPDIMRLITRDLSEPYSIYTYRYFIHNWPRLCFLAICDNQFVGAIVCKLDLHKKMVRRGYIAMLAVDSEFRRRKIGSTLVTKAIEAMMRDDCDEVVLETEITNQSALRLYENLGFVRDKRLFRYYLNGVDALRLKLWLR